MIKHLPGISLLFLLAALAACSNQKPLPDTYYSSAAAQQPDDRVPGMSWWSYRFHIVWPDDRESPDFAVDLLLADTVVRPVLKAFSGNMLWWRFHRRATRELPGHQFSLLFYSDSKTADKVFTHLGSSKMLSAIVKTGLVDSISSSDPAILSKPAIEAYSDRAWPSELQRTWPTYIMGVSSFWLSLIDELKTEQKTDGVSVREGAEVRALLEDYRQIDRKITEMWSAQGQHALLHHLSAIFGYKPMRVRKDIIF